MCLGPDIHKAASLTARWNHAFPYTLALTAKTPPLPPPPPRPCPPSKHAHTYKRKALWLKENHSWILRCHFFCQADFTIQRDRVHGIAVLELRLSLRLFRSKFVLADMLGTLIFPLAVWNLDNIRCCGRNAAQCICSALGADLVGSNSYKTSIRWRRCQLIDVSAPFVHISLTLQGDVCFCWCDTRMLVKMCQRTLKYWHVIVWHMYRQGRNSFLQAFSNALHSPYITEQAATQLQWYDPDAATPCTEQKEHSLTPGTELTSNFPLLITIQ